MALARKCDRCGGFYIPETRKANGYDCNAITTVQRNLSNNYCQNECYDLCPKCLDSFIKWLNNDKQEEA